MKPPSTLDASMGELETMGMWFQSVSSFGVQERRPSQKPIGKCPIGSFQLPTYRREIQRTWWQLVSAKHSSTHSG